MILNDKGEKLRDKVKEKLFAFRSQTVNNLKNFIELVIYKL